MMIKTSFFVFTHMNVKKLKLKNHFQAQLLISVLGKTFENEECHVIKTHFTNGLKHNHIIIKIFDSKKYWMIIRFFSHSKKPVTIKIVGF